MKWSVCRKPVNSRYRRFLKTGYLGVAMPLDHYVSQVHLKNFYSPSLENLMYALRKVDLKLFTPDAQSVCRIEDGSTNAYLREDRAIEEFLKTVEPKYNAALAKLQVNRVDGECVYTIAGFVAYVISCSPAGMRVHSEALKQKAETEVVRLDSQGQFPAPPPELGGMNLTEILNRGIVCVDVDPKFPQAIGIASILTNTAMFGNFKWEILHNDFEDSSYFTSDYPIAMEQTGDVTILNRVVPLAPNLAIRIRPDRTFDRERASLSFSNFDYQSKRLDRKEVAHINKLIVRCAEETVFFRDNHPWVSRFVHRNRGFRIEYDRYRSGIHLSEHQGGEGK